MTNKERFSLALLAAVYLLCSVRYYPGQAAKTLLETVLQILYVAPLPGGATLLLVNFIQKSAGERMPWDRAARIYLTLGIITEFFFGLYHYLDQARM